MTLNMDDDDLTMSMRAPYISMSEVDDLPLLTSDDLMWGAPAAPVDSATAAAMAAAAGKYLIKEEYTPTQQPLQQQLSPQTNTTTTSVSPIKTPQSVTVTARISDLNGGTNNNNENNCNIGNKTIDSSLAALLCGGNVINIQLPQQQQQLQNGNRHILVHHQQQPQHQVIAAAAQAEADKRIKLIDSSNLVHPMVVITPNFNKNSKFVMDMIAFVLNLVGKYYQVLDGIAEVLDSWLEGEIENVEFGLGKLCDFKGNKLKI